MPHGRGFGASSPCRERFDCRGASASRSICGRWPCLPWECRRDRRRDHRGWARADPRRRASRPPGRVVKAPHSLDEQTRGCLLWGARSRLLGSWGLAGCGWMSRRDEVATTAFVADFDRVEQECSGPRRPSRGTAWRRPDQAQSVSPMSGSSRRRKKARTSDEISTSASNPTCLPPSPCTTRPSLVACAITAPSMTPLVSTAPTGE